MNKIIKVITLLTLITCFTATSTVAFAGCPRESKNKVYVDIGNGCEWDYYNHETIKSWSERDKEKVDIASNWVGVVGAGIGAAVGQVAGAVAGAMIGPALGALVKQIHGGAKDWVRSSEDHDFCGVRIKYCNGKITAFEPQ